MQVFHIYKPNIPDSTLGRTAKLKIRRVFDVTHEATKFTFVLRYLGYCCDAPRELVLWARALRLQCWSCPLPQGFPPPTPESKIEIKHYPAYRCATVRYSRELSMAANSAFNPLYSHISSNNISMTAPVETRSLSS